MICPLFYEKQYEICQKPCKINNFTTPVTESSHGIPVQNTGNNPDAIVVSEGVTKVGGC